MAELKIDNSKNKNADISDKHTEVGIGPQGEEDLENQNEDADCIVCSCCLGISGILAFFVAPFVTFPANAIAATISASTFTYATLVCSSKIEEIVNAPEVEKICSSEIKKFISDKRDSDAITNQTSVKDNLTQRLIAHKDPPSTKMDYGAITTQPAKGESVVK